MDIQAKKVQANGLTFNVIDEGSGEVMVLLHGFPDSIKLWRHVIPTFLNAGYRVIAYDQRGFGETDAPVGKENYKLQTLGDDFEAVLAAQGVQGPVKLVGHDWGASLGWNLTINRPHLMSSYVALSVGHPTSNMVDGGYDQRIKAWYTLMYQLEGTAERIMEHDNWAVRRIVVSNHPELDRHWIPDLSRPGRHTAGMNWYRANMEDRARSAGTPLPPVTVPVLGIHSEGDHALNRAQMEGSKNYMAPGVPFQFHEVYDCSHWIPLDKPEELTSLILDYYAQLPA